MKRKAKGGNRPPKRHFDLAEAVAAFYGTAWGEAAVEQFREDAAWHRKRIRKRSQLDWITYVIRLVLTGPVLLERLQGLEWVVEDLQWILHNRRMNKDVDADFWMAMGELRPLFTTGRPVSRGRDFMRYRLIYEMMNQVTTDPEKGLVRVKGMTKTEAINELAELERRKSGKKVNEREIYRSLEWVEKYLAKIKEQLEEGQGSRTQNP